MLARSAAIAAEAKASEDLTLDDMIAFFDRDEQAH
jgi:hypothetical protein